MRQECWHDNSLSITHDRRKQMEVNDASTWRTAFFTEKGIGATDYPVGRDWYSTVQGFTNSATWFSCGRGAFDEIRTYVQHMVASLQYCITNFLRSFQDIAILPTSFQFPPSYSLMEGESGHPCKMGWFDPTVGAKAKNNKQLRTSSGRLGRVLANIGSCTTDNWVQICDAYIYWPSSYDVICIATLTKAFPFVKWCEAHLERGRRWSGLC